MSQRCGASVSTSRSITANCNAGGALSRDSADANRSTLKYSLESTTWGGSGPCPSHCCETSSKRRSEEGAHGHQLKWVIATKTLNARGQVVHVAEAQHGASDPERQGRQKEPRA